MRHVLVLILRRAALEVELKYYIRTQLSRSFPMSTAQAFTVRIRPFPPRGPYQRRVGPLLSHEYFEVVDKKNMSVVNWRAGASSFVRRDIIHRYEISLFYFSFSKSVDGTKSE